MAFKKFEMIQRIVAESPQIKMIARLEGKGYKFLFAPDTSEIINYVAPHRDISEDNYEIGVRYWFAIKALLESKENRNILLPPYVYEINSILDVIRRIKVKEPETIVGPIKALLGNREFEKLLENLGKVGGEDKLEIFQRLGKSYGKEMSLLCELISTHKEIEQWNKLKIQGNLQSAFTLLDYVDNNKVLDNSIEWQLLTDAYRRRDKNGGVKDERNNKVDNIAIKSYYDGWAIEYLIEANDLARKKPAQYPFVIFVSRSFAIDEVAREKLEFYIKDIGELKVFWSPDTYLAYHLVRQSPIRDYYEIVTDLEDLYHFMVEHKEEPEESLDKLINKKLERSNDLIQTIENMSVFYEKINDQDITELISMKDIENLKLEHQAKLLENILEFVKNHNMEAVAYQTKESIDTLWLDFKKNFLSFEISEINYLPHLAIKYPGLRMWIHFRSNLIMDSFKNANNNPYKVIADESIIIDRLYGEQKDLEVDLFRALIGLFRGDLSYCKKILSDLKHSDDLDIKKEAELIRFFISFLEQEQSDQILEDAEKYKGEFGNDPRIFKVLSLLVWKRWLHTEDIEDLFAACEYAEQALKMVKNSLEFKAECWNNLAYFQVLVFETQKEEKVKLKNLKSALDNFQKIYNLINTEKKRHIEFDHTIGKLQFIIALNDHDMEKNEQIELLELGKSHLFKSYRGNPTNKIYKKDWQDAKTKLESFSKRD